jgi:hypothetical protein
MEPLGRSMPTVKEDATTWANYRKLTGPIANRVNTNLMKTG